METFKCLVCRSEFHNDSLLFFYDENTEQITEYNLTMFSSSKYSSSNDKSPIRGYINESYCGECKLAVKIYSIDANGLKYGREKAFKTLEKSLKNRAEYLKMEFYHKLEEKKQLNDNLIEFKEKGNMGDFIVDDTNTIQKELDLMLLYRSYERCKNSLFLIRFTDDEMEKKRSVFIKYPVVNCPKCGKEVLYHFAPLYPCPKCNGRLILTNDVLYD